MASFDDFINSIIVDGNDVKAFELLCKHFLETAPKYQGRETYCAALGRQSGPSRLQT